MAAVIPTNPIPKDGWCLYNALLEAFENVPQLSGAAGDSVGRRRYARGFAYILGQAMKTKIAGMSPDEKASLTVLLQDPIIYPIPSVATRPGYGLTTEEVEEKPDENPHVLKLGIPRKFLPAEDLAGYFDHLSDIKGSSGGDAKIWGDYNVLQPAILEVFTKISEETDTDINIVLDISLGIVRGSGHYEEIDIRRPGGAGAAAPVRVPIIIELKYDGRHYEVEIRGTAKLPGNPVDFLSDGPGSILTPEQKRILDDIMGGDGSSDMLLDVANVLLRASQLTMAATSPTKKAAEALQGLKGIVTQKKGSPALRLRGQLPRTGVGAAAPAPVAPVAAVAVPTWAPSPDAETMGRCESMPIETADCIDYRVRKDIEGALEYAESSKLTDDHPDVKKHAVNIASGKTPAEMDAKYPARAILVRKADHTVESMIVPNPYRSRRYRYDAAVTFAEPVAGPTDVIEKEQFAQNVAVLDAIVPKEVIADKIFARSILEGLWHCGTATDLDNKPECFPLRALGEYRLHGLYADQKVRAEAAKKALKMSDADLIVAIAKRLVEGGGRIVAAVRPAPVPVPAAAAAVVVASGASASASGASASSAVAPAAVIVVASASPAPAPVPAPAPKNLRGIRRAPTAPIRIGASSASSFAPPTGIGMPIERYLLPAVRTGV